MVEVCAVFCYCVLWLETMDVCIWCMSAVVSDCVGSVGMFVV